MYIMTQRGMGHTNKNEYKLFHSKFTWSKIQKISFRKLIIMKMAFSKINQIPM